MRRPLDPADDRLWAIVTSTVRPLPGRSPPKPPKPPVRVETAVVRVERPPLVAAKTAIPAGAKRPFSQSPQPIEPKRHRRLAVEREPLGARIDLHGFDQDRARSVLTDFVLRSRAEGRRSVLVITGKGALGAGVLRRSVPEWLAAPPLRSAVAGLSEAHRRHGGEGALYVALRRLPDRNG
jgi:DNA-nicking Smr family endonuclease